MNSRRGAGVVASPPGDRSTSIRGLVGVGVLATLVAMLATTLCAALARAAGVDFEVPEGGETIPVPGIAVVTGFFSVVGIVLAAGLLRWSARPAERFVRTAVCLTAISLVPPLLSEADTATITTLLGLHLVAASVMIPALTRSLRRRGHGAHHQLPGLPPLRRCGLRMRAVTLMIMVGMSGFVLGPLFGRTACAQWGGRAARRADAPIALVACIGVPLGVPADRPEDLTDDALDLPGAVLSISAIGLACSSLTSGVLHGWLWDHAPVDRRCDRRPHRLRLARRRCSAPMSTSPVSNGTVRGAAITRLPAGAWSSALVQSFFHGERSPYAVLAVVVA